MEAIKLPAQILGKKFSSLTVLFHLPEWRDTLTCFQNLIWEQQEIIFW